jgi:cobalt-zinc-cadmium efflux system protein
MAHAHAAHDDGHHHHGQGHDHDHHPHHHHHHHGHGEGLGHHHAPKDFGPAFAIGIALNGGFVIAETVFGFLSNSTALLADAGHNLSDVAGLVIAWAAFALGKRAPSGRFTYGLRGSSILAALFNGVFLLVAVGAIGLEAIMRLRAPEDVAGTTVMWVAAIGILVNGATAMLFMRGRSQDLNIEGAFLHMAADAAVSAGVVASAALILWTGKSWIDPAVSLLICAVILWSTIGLLRSAFDMALSAAPARVDLVAVRTLLLQRPGVTAIHDLHVWPISTTEIAMTCHLLMPNGHPGDAFLAETAVLLAERHAIGHPTLQIETDAGHQCALAPDHVV